MLKLSMAGFWGFFQTPRMTFSQPGSNDDATRSYSATAHVEAICLSQHYGSIMLPMSVCMGALCDVDYKVTFAKPVKIVVQHSIIDTVNERE